MVLRQEWGLGSMNQNQRWEHGSEFHWLSFQNVLPEISPWSNSGVSFGSGRDAFRALLLHGRETRAWRRLWVPSYFCQQVILSFLSAGVEVSIYPDGPGQPSHGVDDVDFRSGDVVLYVNFFGLNTKKPGLKLSCDDVEIIEDHTHDPWSAWAWSSEADWCVVSLRKTLPVPGGGFLWSPTGHRLPSANGVTGERRTALSDKLASMLLKKLYLEGAPVSKDTFRCPALSGERRIASGNVSGMPDWNAALLSTFPISAWREQRRENHQILTRILAHSEKVNVLQGKFGSEACPFSGFLVFQDEETRNRVRHELIASRIYPAILWPLDEPVLEGVLTEHKELSRLMLSVHCDMRYGKEDMLRVASSIKRALRET